MKKLMKKILDCKLAALGLIAAIYLTGCAGAGRRDRLAEEQRRLDAWEQVYGGTISECRAAGDDAALGRLCLDRLIRLREAALTQEASRGLRENICAVAAAQNAPEFREYACRELLAGN